MSDAQGIWLCVGLVLLLAVLIPITARVTLQGKPPNPITPERERLARLEKLQRAITDALYSTREARIYTSEDLSDIEAVRAMRERLGFACDSLVSAQREVTEWLRVAVAKERADA